MNGLRKVVKLRVYDVPNEKVKLNKDKTYYYNWKNKYYVGNFELHKSKQFNNHTKKNLFNKKYDDKYLDKMIDMITAKDNNIEDNILCYDDFLMYAGEESSIYYFGNNVEDIKKKIIKK